MLFSPLWLWNLDESCLGPRVPLKMLHWEFQLWWQWLGVPVTQGEARRDELELLGESWNLGTSKRKKESWKWELLKYQGSYLVKLIFNDIKQFFKSIGLTGIYWDFPTSLPSAPMQSSPWATNNTVFSVQSALTLFHLNLKITYSREDSINKFHFADKWNWGIWVTVQVHTAKKRHSWS